jgi:DNA-binding beta-propeller fold protein YncE
MLLFPSRAIRLCAFLLPASLAACNSGPQGSLPSPVRSQVSVKAPTASPNVYIADSRDSRVVVFTLAGAFVSQIQGSNTDLNLPVGIALDSKGRIYVAQSNLDVFAPGASGNVAPTVIVSNAVRPAGLAVGAHDESTPSVMRKRRSSCTRNQLRVRPNLPARSREVRRY